MNPWTRCYINTYAPLVQTAVGRAASAERKIPPFVDGSIRREPDLENDFPAITCLCRGGAFAPRLNEGDLVCYMTKKAKYGAPQSHWRLTGVLQVIATLDSHIAGAEWYRSRGIPLANNCMVAGNEPHPISESHQSNQWRNLPPLQWQKKWDAQYRGRVMRHRRFVVCEPIFSELSWAAPMVHDADLKKAFGYLPATRNPGALDPEGFRRFMRRFGIDVLPSSR